MTPIRILIVEDERIVALDLERRLTRLGHHVMANVSTGPDAILAARSGRPDLLVIDVHLPGPLSGRDTAAQICAERLIPVVFVSGVSARDAAFQDEITCPEQFLSKPFTDAALAAAIREALTPPPSPDDPRRGVV
jgi:CheY-like chemotaxis protein